MTQSGQGEDAHRASMRQPREGIVLPADGSEPLMPGATGDQTTPAGGTPWGQPWGPEASGLPPAGPDIPAATPGEAWGAVPGMPQPPAPQWNPGPGLPQQPGPGPFLPSQQSGAALPMPQQPGADALPPAPQHAAGAYPPQTGPGVLPPQSMNAAPLPPAVGYQIPGGGALPPATGQAGALPPLANGGPSAGFGPGGGPSFSGHGDSLPPASSYPGPGAAPLPRMGDEAATQYLPPIAAGGPAPVAGPGALPPEMPAADETQRLGRVPQHQARPAHGRHGAPAPAAHPDSQPTQYIAPVPAAPTGAPYGIRPGAPGDAGAAGQDGTTDRQPPAEFDSLFRTQPEPGDAGSTQRMPRIDAQARGRGQGPYGAGAPGAGAGYDRTGQGRDGYGQDGYASAGHDDAGGRGAQRRDGRGKGPLIAALGVGIVVLGVGAGALLSGGGDDDKKDANKPLSATAPAHTSKSPSVDPAQAQAAALDKLLADSNDSRDAVISAVANVKVCKNLGPSAADLRNAAKQRGSLITRLSGLSVDKLPRHDALTTALTNAWRASASADNHYAAWADQVAGKKGCHKGHARDTGEVGAGNKASGDATRAKQEASGLWNSIARKYGLTTRDKSEL